MILLRRKREQDLDSPNSEIARLTSRKLPRALSLERTIPSLPRRLALLSGLLLTLAFPPVDLFFFAWVGLIPLLEALRRDPRGSWGHCASAGFTFHIGTLYWIGLNVGTHWSLAILSMLLVVAILSIAWGTAGWLFTRAVNLNSELSWLWLPIAWTAWEGWLGNLGEIAFPWPLIAITQNGFDPILQLMEFTGVWGVTFWVVMLNLALWRLWFIRAYRLTWGAVLVSLIVISIISSLHAQRYYQHTYPLIKVAVAQSSAEPYAKWTEGAWKEVQKYLAMSDSAASVGVSLIVWPETAIPDYLLPLSYLRETVTQFSRSRHLTIITGASEARDWGGGKRLFNTAFLITPERGIADRTSKRQLVPMGERVPFQWLFPALGKLNLGQAEFVPGPRLAMFSFSCGEDTVKTPVLICFESAFPHITREAVRKGANFLTTISNDAWYGRSSEPFQITALSRFRCIETRRSMARASNTGISFISDHLGRIVVRTKLFTPEWRAAEVPLVEKTTFYVRAGDWLLGLTTLLWGFKLLLTAIIPRR